MKDWYNYVEFFFSVIIIFVDDELLMVSVNIGFLVIEGQVVQIFFFVLSVIDIDFEDLIICFVLEDQFLEEKEEERGWDLVVGFFYLSQFLGEMLLRQVELFLFFEEEDWYYVGKEGFYETVVIEWFQRDIMEGKVFYYYFGFYSF